jgi:molybdate transport system substrate-binding protein
MRRSFRGALLASAVAIGLVACSPASTPDGSPSREPAAAPGETITLQVFAAASLKDAFSEIEGAFEDANPGVDVEFNFAGSSELAAQIVEGAPADAFASANVAQMEAVEGAVPTPKVFASNTLTIVVPAGNPAGVAGIDDLAGGDVTLVVCAPEVPCGAATAKVEEEQGVDFEPVSEESNVTDVVGKVASGEADAGIVYVTDVARADGVESVYLDGAEKAVNLYPIGSLARSEHPEAAKAFVEWVLSEPGQRVLASYGFGAA